MARMLRCAWCDAPFIQQNKRGPIPRYCRPSHRQRAFQARHWVRVTPEAGVPADLVTSALAELDQFLEIAKTIATGLGEFSTLLTDAGVPLPVVEALVLGQAKKWGLST